MKYLQLLLCAGVCLLLAADEPKKDAVKEAKMALIGTWQVQTIEKRGMDITKLLGRNSVTSMKWEFTEDKFIPRSKTTSEPAEEYTIDPNKNPKHIDLTTETGKTLGVCTIEGDTLLISYGPVGEDRPSQLKTTEKDKPGIRLYVLRRVKS